MFVLFLCTFVNNLELSMHAALVYANVLKISDVKFIEWLDIITELRQLAFPNEEKRNEKEIKEDEEINICAATSLGIIVERAPVPVTNRRHSNNPDNDFDLLETSDRFKDVRSILALGDLHNPYLQISDAIEQKEKTKKKKLVDTKAKKKGKESKFAFPFLDPNFFIIGEIPISFIWLPIFLGVLVIHQLLCFTVQALCWNML